MLQQQTTFTPVCGQCVNYQGERRWISQFTGEEVVVPGFCKLLAFADMQCTKQHSSDAAECALYQEAIPF